VKVYDINMKCHQQDTDYYCSAASAQMLLRHFGNGIISQDELYSYGYKNNSPAQWGSFNDSDNGLYGISRNGGVDPTGVEMMLNHNNYSNIHAPGAPKQGQFKILENTDRDRMIRDIVTILVDKRMPMAVLVKQASHWVVARGAHIDGDPAAGEDFTLFGMTINNPSPPLVYNLPQGAKRPPPHTDNDICGTTGDTIGSSDEFVSYEDWEDDWLTPVGFTPNSTPSMVAVYKTPYTMKKPGKVRSAEHSFIPKKNIIIETKALKTIIRDEARLHGLNNNKSYASALKNASPANPILVQRLDKKDSYYYIVPMVREKLITSTALVDAVRGVLLGFRPFKNPVDKLFMTQDEIMKKLTQHPVNLEGDQAKLKLREGAYHVEPNMVWKLCKESLSKYHPFHIVTIGKTRFYVGWDGKVYTRLHDPGRFG
jgi:hypothetical protein